jgi:competence protein ComEC
LSAAVGFGVAALRTALVAAPQLQAPINFAHVEGRVIGIEPFPTGIRATLDQVTIQELHADTTPERILVKISKGTAGLEVGDRLDLLARLQPPSPPAAPGAFDFRRQAFFQRIGATGFALGAARPVTSGEAPALMTRTWLAIDRLRASIGQRIATLEPGPAGAMARALTVGDQTALSNDDTDAMRISGLAHLLSISGLHIGMAAGLFFFGLRGLLALAPPLALRFPIKKWSALAAIGAAGFYTLLASPTVPTLRSFFMIAILFIGVLVDRSPFSFRMLAWAAIALLLLFPESVTGASFQMSFFAVLGLIAVFEGLRSRISGWRAGRPPTTDWFGRVTWLLHRAGFWLGSLMLTSLVATIMTAPFAIYHFDRLSSYGLVANLLAVPLTGFWVMPTAMAALLLMPLGLDAPFWHAAAWGCEGILWIARTVAAWPHSVVMLPAMPVTALVAVMLGLLVICLVRTRWRLLGVGPVLAGFAVLFFTTTPDLLISGDAKLIAVKDENGRYWLNSSRAGRFSADTWLRRNGQTASASFRDDNDALPPAFACDPLGCSFAVRGREIALALSGEAVEEDCTRADLLLAVVPVRRSCRYPRLTIDRFDVWRGGAHAVWLRDGGGFRVESVAASLGDRPWVLERMREGLQRRRLLDFRDLDDTDGDGQEADDVTAATDLRD